jgi:hypothetical protein
MTLGIALRGVLCSFLIFTTAASSQVPSGRDVVMADAYASFEPVSRNHEFQLGIVMKIRPGFHVNAREKSEDYLIATDLQAEVPEGIKTGNVSYPKGKLEKFAFSKKPLNVYQGTVILKLPVTVLQNAPVSTLRIPLKLRFQACNKELCLPPVTLNFDARVSVTGAASEAKPAHPEIFREK